MVGNDVIIRTAEEKDFDFLIKANAMISEKDSHTKLENIDRFKNDLFQNPVKAFAIIAEVEGVVAGMALYSTNYFANEGELMWVSQMYVEPQFRNSKQWIAPALMAQLIKIAQEKGWDYICWATDTANAIPQKLSKKLGAKALDNFVMYALSLNEE